MCWTPTGVSLVLNLSGSALRLASERKFMNTKSTKRTARAYVIEATVAILLCYFLLGGSDWSPALWAVFAVLAISIVVMNVRRDAGVQSAAAYDCWKLQVVLLMVLGVLSASIWRGSLWLFILSLVLGAIWVIDLRAHRDTYIRKAVQEGNDVAP